MFESIYARIVLTTLVASALATTGVMTKDLVGSLYAVQMPKQGIDIQPTVSEPTITPTIVVSPTLTPTMEPLVEKKTVTTGKCIITLFGVKYDVTEPNKNHVGGDIFNCGRDMSAIYKTKHGTDVSRMQGYLVDKPTPTVVLTNINTSSSVVPTNTVAPTPTTKLNVASPTSTPTTRLAPSPTVSVYKYSDDKDEREDKENEDRYVEDHFETDD